MYKIMHTVEKYKYDFFVDCNIPPCGIQVLKADIKSNNGGQFFRVSDLNMCLLDF